MKEFVYTPTPIRWLSDSEWVLTPTQGRSREGLEKILHSALELFVDKGFEETTITQISKHSGVSVGSIYHRFTDKQSILYMILESYKKIRFDQVEALIEAEDWSEKTVDDVLRFQVEVIFSSTQKDIGIMRLIERQRMTDDYVRDTQIEWDKRIFGIMADLYRPYAAQIPHADIDQAIQYLHGIIRGSVLWSILSYPRGDHPIQIEDQSYRCAAYQMAAGYLGLSPTD